jgi:predicted extracellular nuclease
MMIRNFVTPLIAAFFCVLILPGCVQDISSPEASTVSCAIDTTPIANVQGRTAESPMLGQKVAVQGIVTLLQTDHGIYIEEPESDTDIRTSNAIFIQSDHLPGGIAPGALISAQGTVSEIGDERFSLTAITDISAISVCADDQKLPLSAVSLPLNGSDRESIEAMRIRIEQKLTVTDVYRFGQGKFTLSGNGFQFVPTEIMKPGPDTNEHIAQNRAYALPALLPADVVNKKLLVGDTTAELVTGVLTHDGRDLRLWLQETPIVSNAGLSKPPSAASGALRIVGLNLHNYFNGDGKGHDYPTPRGAKTFAGFQAQRHRIGAAISVLNPQVLAVMELENDGFDSDSAAQDFIQLANNATGGDWAVARPADDNTGTDKVTVGLFYRADKLKSVGAAQTLTGPEFKRSRQPQAQVFQTLDNGEKTLIVINHLKSKGSCPKSGTDANQKDGQGCWNPMRTVSAQKMSAWTKTLAANAQTDNILILGDMNAYRNEDPIVAIRDAGFTELMDAQQGNIYSYVFFGQRGTLDYAFVSDALRENVESAFIWHVNAALPANIDLPQPWLRFSDHDPVVVDIRSRQSTTSD